MILIDYLEHPFDLVMTDYIGLWGIRDADLFGFYKCRIRVLDSFGTEPLCKWKELLRYVCITYCLYKFSSHFIFP